MGYLNKFATQAAYESAKYDLSYPAISYIEATDDFVFDKVALPQTNWVSSNIWNSAATWVTA